MIKNRYGTKYFRVKEPTVFPERTITIKDAAAYGELQSYKGSKDNIVMLKHFGPDNPEALIEGEGNVDQNW